MVGVGQPTVGFRRVINKAVLSVYPFSDMYHLDLWVARGLHLCGTPVYRRAQARERSEVRDNEGERPMGRTVARAKTHAGRKR